MPASGTEQRRLAAIMFTDMVGYSALAHRDEAIAVELLVEHRDLLRSIFPAYAGREVETAGDAFLVEFASALEATRCALCIQQRLAHRNDLASPSRQFRVRIGIHLGDVLHRGNQLFGDTINIAARVEPLAYPGGICVTRAVRDQVANKVHETFVPLQSAELKNIAQRIEVFRIDSSFAQGAADNRSSAHAGIAGRRDSNQPAVSVAVLPFVNLTSDSGNEHFGDGLTEELINALSNLPGFTTPARTSVFAFKGHNDDIRRIGAALNVDTLLAGSVRSSGQRLRIAAQLIDAVNGFHLWSERYDRAKSDPFEIQDDVSREIVQALEFILKPQTWPVSRRIARNGCLEASSVHLRRACATRSWARF
jgi:adenylate cyclase